MLFFFIALGKSSANFDTGSEYKGSSGSNYRRYDESESNGPDYREVEVQSYGSQIKDSIYGTIFGIILFLGGTILLFWNEGHQVKNEAKISKSEKNVIELNNIQTVDQRNEGKLVYCIGTATTNSTITDPNLNLTVDAIKLSRSVSYYQWVEEDKTHTENKMGGQKVITHNYYHHKEWKSSPVNSSNFHGGAEKKNMTLMDLKSESWTVDEVQFGAFHLNQSQIKSLDCENSLQIQNDFKELNDSLCKAHGFQEMVHVTGNQIYLGCNPSDPAIGDMKIEYKIVPNNSTLTVVANQSGDSFRQNKNYISYVKVGSYSLDEVFDNLRSQNSLWTWIWRIVGTICVIISLFCIFDILETILKVLPFLSDIVGSVVGVVCFIIGLIWSLCIIAIAYMFYRPFKSIILFGVIGLLIVGLKELSKR